MREEHRPGRTGCLGRGRKGGPGPDPDVPETKGAELYFGSKVEPLKGFKQTRNVIRFEVM